MEMTTRERFLKIAHFDLNDDIFIPSRYQWFWYDVLDRWVKEGVSIEILSNEHREEYFGFDRVEILPVVSGLQCLGKAFGPPYVAPYIPFFERKVIEEGERTRIIITEGGQKAQEYKDQPERMPQWIESPVKNRKDWQNLKKRLDPHSSTRFPAWWIDKVKCWRNRDYPLGLSVGSFFGYLREFLGLENLCILYYDNPRLIHEIQEWLEYFAIEIIKKVVKDIKPDFAFYWEDMAGKQGSIISPKIFREFMMPYYKKINDFLRSNAVDIILVDSDGNTEELIPLWIESGINGQYPLEVTAGMDALKLRKKYGKNFILIGNIDKRVLTRGKKAIKEEIMRKVPLLLSKGGYFPALDHFCPPDVSFENYMFYLKVLREICGGTNIRKT
jgi:uroporphyrinogen decarboxylase